ncbi:MAG: hypothetical protein JWM47_853 [Acidimicrobiales bacterium]|nr:hypothetical protein [Acidimicrobiales bacterium]
MAAWRKMLVVFIALLATVASVASSSDSDGGGDKKTSTDKAADTKDSGKTAAGDNGEVDDVKIDSCGEKDALGFVGAGITVTNDSTDPSDYMIEITFTSKDGKVQIGTGNTIISNLANGQSKTEKINALEETDQTEIVCTVSNVDRYAST